MFAMNFWDARCLGALLPAYDIPDRKSRSHVIDITKSFLKEDELSMTEQYDDLSRSKIFLSVFINIYLRYLETEALQ